MIATAVICVIAWVVDGIAVEVVVLFVVIIYACHKSKVVACVTEFHTCHGLKCCREVLASVESFFFITIDERVGRQVVEREVVGAFVFVAVLELWRHPYVYMLRHQVDVVFRGEGKVFALR